MQDLTLFDALEALVAEHDRVGSPLRDELRPGPVRGQVEDAVRGVGLDPPQELIDFFTWHEVAARRGSLGRTDWFWPAGALRLDEAIETYRRSIAVGGASWAQVGDSLGPEPPPATTFTGFWRTDWFPVLAGSPETYAIECPGGDGSTPGALWRVNWHPDPEFQTARVASSLTEFIGRVVDLFRSGAYRWDAKHEAVITVDDVFVRRGVGATFRP